MCVCRRERQPDPPERLLEGDQVRNVQRFRGGLVFKAHRPLYHSTLGLRVIKKKGRWGDEKGLRDLLECDQVQVVPVDVPQDIARRSHPLFREGYEDEGTFGYPSPITSYSNGLVFL